MAVPLEDLRNRTALGFEFPPPFIGSYPQKGQVELAKPDMSNLPLPSRAPSTMLHPSRQHRGWHDEIMRTIPTMKTALRP
jgi:hypothetical protein